METLLAELTHGLPDFAQFMRVAIRMIAAALLGAIVGIQREHAGKAAGLRTHMLVCAGAALFVIAPLEFGIAPADMSRVIQGLTTGIGFIGAGAILKLSGQREIKGLTTAAGLWMTGAIGAAAGLGRWGSAALGVAIILIILSVIGRLEARFWRDRSSVKIEEVSR